MRTAIKQALTGLLGSKKAWMAFCSAVAAGVMKLGYDIDTETVGVILSPILTAIIGQGIADGGKGKSVTQVVAS